METMEIMNNEEVIVAAEEIIAAVPKKSMSFGAKAGIATVATVAVYAIGKYVVKPAIAKHKAKKAEREIIENDTVVEYETEETATK